MKSVPFKKKSQNRAYQVMILNTIFSPQTGMLRNLFINWEVNETNYASNEMLCYLKEFETAQLIKK